MVKLFVGSRGTMQMFDSVLNLQLNLLVDVVKGNFNRLPLRTVDFHSFGEGPKMLLLDASLPLSPALPAKHPLLGAMKGEKPPLSTPSTSKTARCSMSMWVP